MPLWALDRAYAGVPGVTGRLPVERESVSLPAGRRRRAARPRRIRRAGRGPPPPGPVGRPRRRADGTAGRGAAVARRGAAPGRAAGAAPRRRPQDRAAWSDPSTTRRPRRSCSCPAEAERDRRLARAGPLGGGPRCARPAPPVRGSADDGGRRPARRWSSRSAPEANAADATFAYPLDLLAIELLIRIPERYQVPNARVTWATSPAPTPPSHGCRGVAPVPLALSDGWRSTVAYFGRSPTVSSRTSAARRSSRRSVSRASRRCWARTSSAAGPSCVSRPRRSPSSPVRRSRSWPATRSSRRRRARSATSSA